MAEFLILRINKAATHGTWIAVDGSGNRVTGLFAGELHEAASEIHGRRLIVLVPGAEVVLTQAALPVRSQAKILQMLPYSLEESVAEDVDRLFFAPGNRDAQGNVLAAIISRQLLENWLARLTEAGLSPHAMYAETQGVPRTPGSLTLVIDGPTCFIGTPGQLPLVFEGLSVSSALSVITEDIDDQTMRHIVVYCDAADNERYETTWGRLRESAASVDVHVQPEGTLPRFAAALVNEPGVNLLQGPYAPRSEWGPMLQPWRVAASLVAALLLLVIGVEGTELYTLSKRDQQLTSALEDKCRAVFPGTSGLTACRSQLERRMGERAGDSGKEQQFFSTLLSVGTAVGDQAELQSLNFRNGIMDLKIVAPNVETLDKIQRQVSAGSGLQAEIQSANPTDAGVEGRLQVKGSS